MAETLYRYRALTPEGRVVEGEMAALNPSALAAALAALSLEMISARPVSLRRLAGRTLNRRELIDLFYYLEILLKAGVSPIDALRDLATTADGPALRLVALGMAESIENGATFADALASQPAAAKGAIPALIRSGESSGALDQVLGEIVAALKWQDEVIAAAKKAMLYPAFALTVISGVVVFLMSYLVPQLIPFIREMGGELPFYTVALIWVSDLVKRWWWLLFSAPFALFMTLMAAARASRALRKRLHALMLRLPIMGSILSKIFLAQVVNTLAMMYRSGIPLLDAIDMTAESCGNLVIADGLRLARNRVAAGAPLSRGFAEAAVFPPLVLRMLRVGENSGQLDEALMNAKYFYLRDINEAVGKLQSLIEPALVVSLGLVLGWIMLAVLGPIYDMLSKLKLT